MVIEMKLYYGANDLIIKPVFGKGNPSNDYGLGFYLTPEYDMAVLWASKFHKNGYAITYEVDLSSMNVLYLNSSSKEDVLKWITLLVSHRFSRDEYEKYKTQIEWLKKTYSIAIDNYDMIVGYRADDSYFKYSEEFVNNNLSLELLKRAMEIGKLGLQYVLISKKAFNSIKYISHAKVDHTEEYERFRLKTLQEYNNLREQDSINNTFIRDIMRENK